MVEQRNLGIPTPYVVSLNYLLSICKYASLKWAKDAYFDAFQALSTISIFLSLGLLATYQQREDVGPNNFGAWIFDQTSTRSIPAVSQILKVCSRTSPAQRRLIMQFL